MRLWDKAARGANDWSVEGKMILSLFAGFVGIPFASFLVLQTGGAGAATRFLVVALTAGIVLLVPAAKWLSRFVALRAIRALNDQCALLKEGNYDLVDLPSAEREGNDFLRLQRNMHWMGHAIATREHRLRRAMADLALAQRRIGQSLDYASLIQTAFLPGPRLLDEYLPDHFLIWEQRDTVGGDACWLAPTANGFFVGVIDCTGHGVPGAFMTLIVASLLSGAAADTESPAEVLGRMNRRIKDALGQNGREARSDDGMDCGLCHVARGGLVFAGANTPLLIADGNGARIIRGDRCGLGYVRSPRDFTFTDVPVAAGPESCLYLATDGVTDQVGGERRLPYGRRRLLAFMERRWALPPAEQGEALRAELAAWQGGEVRRDDVTIIGFKLGEAVK